MFSSDAVASIYYLFGDFFMPFFTAICMNRAHPYYRPDILNRNIGRHYNPAETKCANTNRCACMLSY